MYSKTSVALGLLATVHATFNEVSGTDGSDKMFGGAGFDIMYGEGGPNNLVGGPDGDTATFGDGNDFAFGAGGDDTMHGQADNDKFYGGEGDDTMNGDNGDDTVFGGYGDDNMFGGSDTDTMNGQWGEDIMRGGADDDEIRGDGGADLAYLDTDDTMFVNILNTGKARKIVLSSCMDKFKDGNQMFVCPAETYTVKDDGDGTPAWTEDSLVTETYDDICQGMVPQATLDGVQNELNCVKNGDVWNAGAKTCDAASAENCLRIDEGNTGYEIVYQAGQKYTTKSSAEECNSACKLVTNAELFTYKTASQKCYCKLAASGFKFFEKPGRVSAYLMDTFSSTPCGSED